MNKLISLLFSLFLVLGLQAQSELPAIELNDLDGNKIGVSDYAADGKITVISFWATWCSPCKKELSNISDIYEEWQEEWDVEVVAVNIDDQRNFGKVKPYVNGQGWEFTCLMDTNEELKRGLNIQTVPYTIVLDKNGEIAYQHSGYTEGDEYELEEIIEELDAVE